MNSPEPTPAPANGADLALADALDAALATCRQQIDHFLRHPATPWTKRNIHGGREPVTALDIRLQDTLTTALGRDWPGLPVIAEEGTTTLHAVPDHCLLVDPLDGTAPLLDGSPFYAIAICLIHAGRPVQGLIDLPAYDLRIAATPTTLTITGDPDRLPAYRPDTVLTSPRHTRLATQLLPHRPIVGVPTATAKMTLVALRRAPAAAYLPAGSGAAAPWDYPAAALALHASGATVHDHHGHDLASTRPTRLHGWLATTTADPDLNVLLRPAHP
ncbi:inositol monophosphatase [Streptomyces luteireticuli]|uniref:inositol monophosphatase family protein n=1 Tax=Streptomyces luteireticuli TaxID=173858 RepID=UPI003555FC73